MTAPHASAHAAAPAGEAVWGLQILRFVAASMVLISHLNHEVLQRPALAHGFAPFAPVWWAGGVDVFFVISGFIMYHIAAGQFGVPGAARRFAVRRLVRLVPPYWFFTALALLAMATVPGQMAHNRLTAAQVAGSFLFWPVLAPDGRPTPVLILGWTLEFEMLFYAVFALALRWPRARGLAVIAGVLGALAAIGLIDGLPMPFRFWANPIVLEFLFGIAVAAAFRRGMRLHPASALMLIAGAIGVLVWVQAMGWPGVTWVWRFAWAGVPAAMLCAGVALVRLPQRPPALMRALVVLGDASYALYLSHPFTLAVIAIGVEQLHATAAIGYIAVAYAASLGAATALHLALERPLHRWLLDRLKRPAAPPALRVAPAGGPLA